MFLTVQPQTNTHRFIFGHGISSVYSPEVCVLEVASSGMFAQSTQAFGEDAARLNASNAHALAYERLIETGPVAMKRG